MEKINIADCISLLQRNGRTVYTEDGVLFCNWTCSGIRFSFTGTTLAIRIKSIPSIENGQTFFPWLGVVMDDGEDLACRIELNQDGGLYTIFQSEKKETHVITLVKLTENHKGKMGFMAFLTDGHICAAPIVQSCLRLEFIGDSITCGFGNMVNDPDRAFYAQEENGWMSHAAVAARRLKAQYTILSCSGITVTESLEKQDWGLPPMPYFYPYQDRFFHETIGQSKCEEHDFSAFHPDAIVINLGTNDSVLIGIDHNEAAGIVRFKNEYKRFLSMIRSLNGPAPKIICALGSMDYFLYDCILQAAKEYIEENQDDKIYCFKYNKVRPDEGLGACRHPYVTTQIRMGKEIADFIRTIL